jgi:hypothetical protein
MENKDTVLKLIAELTDKNLLWFICIYGEMFIYFYIFYFIDYIMDLDLRVYCLLFWLT